jgi:hypothetical protein
MKKSWVLLISLVFIVALDVASAEVLISQPKSAYNIGDTLTFQFTLQPGQASSGFALSTLVCGESEVEVYRNAVSVVSGESKSIDVSVPLTPAIIGSSSGSCVVKSTYGSDSVDSAPFTITSHIDVQITLNAPQYAPNDILSISGKAVRDDGIAATGFMKISLGNVSITVPVNNGVLIANLSVPSASAPGDNSFKVDVYEKDANGEITNSGAAERTVKIKQVTKSILIQIDALEVSPGSPFTYTVSALDQVGASSEKDVTFVVSMPDGQQYLTKLVRSATPQEIVFPLNVSSGVWTISASLDGLMESKTFSMPDVQRANFTIVNDTLVVNNIGNVPYTKSVEVTIGGKTIVKPLSLGVGGSRVFKLLAPSSNYTIQINDGLVQTSAFSVPLTGRAIDLGEVKSFGGVITPAILIVLVLVILFIVARVRKSRKFGDAPRSFKEYQHKSPGLVRAVASSDSNLEQGRETAAIIALRLPTTSPAAFQEMLSALKQRARARKAHAESRGNFMLFVLTQMLTGPGYELEALKLAQEIQRSIKSAAASGAMQVPSSIGITKGEIIGSGNAQRFSFTALGNAVSKAQKLASQANGEIFISDAIKAAIGTQARVTRVPGNDAWKVDNVVNRDEYSGFIDTFKKKYDRKY